ncbi:MAG: flavodoxin domain-containing protein [Thermodesulfobacteriota bacterium]
MARALVIFASKTGETAEIAHLIADGISESGMQVKTMPAASITSDEQLNGYDAYALGSSVYNEQMLPELEEVLCRLSRMPVQGKIGAAFGSYEWNEEVPGQIHKSMEQDCGLIMAGPALAFKPPLLGHKEKQSRELGRTIARMAGTVAQDNT